MFDEKKKRYLILSLALISMVTIAAALIPNMVQGQLFSSDLDRDRAAEDQKGRQINEEGKETIAIEAKKAKANLANYRAANEWAKATQNGQEQALSKIPPQAILPPKGYIAAALEKEVFPDAAQIKAYVVAQQAQYENEADVRAFVDDFCRLGGLTSDDYWQVIIPAQAINNLVTENLSNQYLLEKGKEPIYGLPESKVYWKNKIGAKELAPIASVEEADQLVKPYLDSLKENHSEK